MKFKVVVVDDDEDTRDYITMALETWEHERFSFDIELADDALKALDILHNLPVDILIADLKMPIMRGDQMIDVLRSNEGINQDVPILIISGYPEICIDKLQNEGYENIFFVDKPFALAAFHRKVTFAAGFAMKKRKKKK